MVVLVTSELRVDAVVAIATAKRTLAGVMYEFVAESPNRVEFAGPASGANWIGGRYGAGRTSPVTWADRIVVEARGTKLRVFASFDRLVRSRRSLRVAIVFLVLLPMIGLPIYVSQTADVSTFSSSLWLSYSLVGAVFALALVVALIALGRGLLDDVREPFQRLANNIASGA